MSISYDTKNQIEIFIKNLDYGLIGGLDDKEGNLQLEKGDPYTTLLDAIFTTSEECDRDFKTTRFLIEQIKKTVLKQFRNFRFLQS